MTREESVDLIIQAQNGSEKAKERLVSENLGLVRSVAMRFRSRGVEYDDLIQIASLGMLKAIKSFDTNLGTAFSTYAVPLMIGEIRRFLRDDGAVKVGRGVKKLGADAMRRREQFCTEMGREPKVSELAEMCGVALDELVYALDACSPIKSLSDPIGDDDGATVGDLICDGNDGIGALTDRIALSEAVRGLSAEQRKLIYLRYVKEMSQERAGRVLGMTQVKVSREEKKIIQSLKAVL